MKVSFIWLSCQIILSVSFLQHITAERMIRLIFNNGMTPSSLNSCTVNDFKLIDPLFTVATNRRNRHLRSINELDTESHHNHRELSTAKCKDNCLGYATGTCRSTSCRPRRHHRVLGEENVNDENYIDDISQQQYDRELSTCEENISFINDALDVLITNNLVSSGCKSYLDKSKRNATCYDDIIYGEIESFNFWNMKKDNIISGMFSLFGFTKPVIPSKTNVAKNGFIVCNNIPLNIEAVLNQCVDNVNFTITGPNRFRYNRFDYSDPMYLFDPILFGLTNGGRYMEPGTYFIEAIPDHFTYKEKNLTFTVIRC
jgi:hypothetical protein